MQTSVLGISACALVCVQLISIWHFSAFASTFFFLALSTVFFHFPVLLPPKVMGANAFLLHNWRMWVKIITFCTKDWNQYLYKCLNGAPNKLSLSLYFCQSIFTFGQLWFFEIAGAASANAHLAVRKNLGQIEQNRNILTYFKYIYFHYYFFKVVHLVQNLF